MRGVEKGVGGEKNSAFSEVFLELRNFLGELPIEFPAAKEIARH